MFFAAEKSAIPNWLTMVQYSVIDWTVSPNPQSNSYVEALTPSVTIFGDRAFKDVLRLKEVIRVGP